MAVQLKPLSHLITAGAGTIIIKTTLELRIVAIQDRVVFGEDLNELRVNLPDGEQDRHIRHLAVIPAVVHKPNLLVGAVAQAEAEVKPPRHPAEVDPAVEEGVNF